MRNWFAVMVMGWCAVAMAAGSGDAQKDAKMREAFWKFHAAWAEGKLKECEAWFAKEGEGLTWNDAMKKRAVPEEAIPHRESVMDVKVEEGKLRGKARASYLVPREAGAKEKTLLVIEEKFLISPAGDGFKVAEYERTDVTEATRKVLEGFVEQQLKGLRDKEKPVAGRQSDGGFACHNLCDLGEAKRAWPIVKEMYELGTDEVSNSNLAMFQGVLRDLKKIEEPPEEYREMVEKILAMKPKKG